MYVYTILYITIKHTHTTCTWTDDEQRSKTGDEKRRVNEQNKKKKKTHTRRTRSEPKRCETRASHEKHFTRFVYILSFVLYTRSLANGNDTSFSFPIWKIIFFRSFGSKNVIFFIVVRIFGKRKKKVTNTKRNGKIESKIRLKQGQK